MVRRSRRYYRRRPYKTQKYSSETTFISDDIKIPWYQGGAGGNIQQFSVPMVGNTDMQGMRKAKNFTIHFDTTSNIPLVFALVYVPGGTTPQEMSSGTFAQTASLYEPNQNVILSGIVLNTSPQLTFRTRLARNLNSGDFIALLIKPLDKATWQPIGEEKQPDFYTPSVAISLNYAISY